MANFLRAAGTCRRGVRFAGACFAGAPRQAKKHKIRRIEDFNERLTQAILVADGAMGSLLYDSVGHWLIDFYGYGDKVEAFRAGYAEYGAWIILLKGLTPIPYKLVTITSGFANYNIWLFVLCSILARGGRFFVVAILLNRYGEWIRVRIEKHLGLWVALGAGVLVLGFIVAFRMF